MVSINLISQIILLIAFFSSGLNAIEYETKFGFYNQSLALLDITNETKLNWYKNSSSLQILNATTIDTKYYQINDTAAYSELVIRHLNETDSGFAKYLRIYGNGTSRKQYEIHLADEQKNYKGFFQIRDNEKFDLSINYTQKTIPIIQSQYQNIVPISYLYKFEALPLNSLKIFNSGIPYVQECASSNSIHKCLFANSTFLFVSYSEDNCLPEMATIKLSYDYNYTKEFKDQLNLIPLEFNVSVKLEQPSFLKYFELNLLSNSTMPGKGDKIGFECELVCANPKTLKYNWYMAITCEGPITKTYNITNISSQLNDTLWYTIDCNYIQINASCTVSNGIEKERKEFAFYSLNFDPSKTTRLPPTTSPINYGMKNVHNYFLFIFALLIQVITE